MSDTLCLKGMAFHAYHGLYEEEKEKGQLYEVDIQMSLNLEKVCATDCIEDGIDYSKVYAVVKEEMEIPSRLIENVAQRICSRIKHDFPETVSVTVNLRKPHPPIKDSVIDCAEVVLTR